MYLLFSQAIVAGRVKNVDSNWGFVKQIVGMFGLNLMPKSIVYKNSWQRSQFQQ